MKPKSQSSTSYSQDPTRPCEVAPTWLQIPAEKKRELLSGIPDRMEDMFLKEMKNLVSSQPEKKINNVNTHFLEDTEDLLDGSTFTVEDENVNIVFHTTLRIKKIND